MESASNVQLPDWLRQKIGLKCTNRPQMYSCLIGSDSNWPQMYVENAISLTFDSNSTSGFEESDVLTRNQGFMAHLI